MAQPSDHHVYANERLPIEAVLNSASSMPQVCLGDAPDSEVEGTSWYASKFR